MIAFGPGLHMLRDDTSPVKARIKFMSEAMPHLAFSACGNTRENMTRAEAKDVSLISQAKVVKAGVVRLLELQEQGATQVVEFIRRNELDLARLVEGILIAQGYRTRVSPFEDDGSIDIVADAGAGPFGFELPRIAVLVNPP